jgi:predicted secreted protein
MLGSTNSVGSGGYDIWFIKTDANGDKIADKVYGGAYDEEGGSLVKTREGHHILIGSTRSFGSGGFDAWLIMTDQNGEKIWDQIFGSKLDDKGYSVIQRMMAALSLPERQRPISLRLQEEKAHATAIVSNKSQLPIMMAGWSLSDQLIR